MADHPYMPLFTDAYIADTQHLTNEEHGVYLRLLMFAWRTPTCSLPDDDKRLAIMVGVGPKKWRQLRLAIEPFFTIEDGQLVQKRLLAEHFRVKQLVSQRRDAGNKSAQSRALKNNETGSTSVATKQATKPPTKGQRKTSTHIQNKEQSSITNTECTPQTAEIASAREDDLDNDDPYVRPSAAGRPASTDSRTPNPPDLQLPEFLRRKPGDRPLNDIRGGEPTSVLESLGKSLNGRRTHVDYSDTEEGRANRKARWQSKVLAVAQAEMTDTDFQKFSLAWLKDEGWALQQAEEISERIKLAEARKKAAELRETGS